ncbi:ATP-binding protein [Methylocystis sp. MJC1]|jgi:two-component system osmolarity sensor histidine kinase EnvZ|uniref:ATP-binding protein n=1 Tax=Methylocystis sp. MJC1 TaxID=2654282 RepID=UPI0013ECD447|nr:ATP-binding protein [Methylocystis sp. MJC1]KAF2992166.1 Sensor histidine kinase CpxA [Methylocystis sp. MJC1]MBU6527306.1 HAMP domain-containing protein [Methylocystis sp. MJC1]UZX10257.1 ATP-binding protein [Methylocystis sp. MJC1]
MSVVIAEVLSAPLQIWRRFADWLHARMPKGLYARALLIVILPVVLLQSAVAYVYMERHWEVMTYRLSGAVARQVATIVDAYQTFPDDAGHNQLRRIAALDLNMELTLLPKEPLPEPLAKKPIFSLLDKALSIELSRKLLQPYWINTGFSADRIEIRVALNDATLRMLIFRSHAYASNSYIFFMWMAIASIIILAIATSFLRNQIRPILRLARAAEEFGKGRDVQFSPRGAREVRQAGAAFVEMKRRVERAIEQRTTMLNGVSHDLRTIITRFKLSLALMGDTNETGEMRKDVDEMERMVEAYLAFARGDGGETSTPTDIKAILEELKADTERRGEVATLQIEGDPIVVARPAAIKRLLANLVGNAQRYGKTLAFSLVNDGESMIVHIDDDGPGIPVERREDAFRPFYRLDESRTQDSGNSGLGLAIARDIARSHGGDITLDRSPLGGLRATVTLPI